jgi:Ca2+-dependent lipid-binding protein
VTAISGEDLPAMDLNGKSDPYVKLTLKKTKTKYKTRVISSPDI